MPRRDDDSPNWGGTRPKTGRKVTTGTTVQTVAVSLPHDLVEAMKAEAVKRGISQSKVVVAALTAYLVTDDQGEA
jgi:hypothetical protein